MDCGVKCDLEPVKFLVPALLMLVVKNPNSNFYLFVNPLGMRGVGVVRTGVNMLDAQTHA